MVRIIEPSRRFPLLSRREGQVLDLIALGRSNAEAAEHLGISVRTVEVHRRTAMRKLGVVNFTGLLWLALVGTVPPEDSDHRDPTEVWLSIDRSYKT